MSQKNTNLTCVKNTGDFDLLVQLGLALAGILLLGVIDQRSPANLGAPAATLPALPAQAEEQAADHSEEDGYHHDNWDRDGGGHDLVSSGDFCNT